MASGLWDSGQQALNLVEQQLFFAGQVNLCSGFFDEVYCHVLYEVHECRSRSEPAQSEADGKSLR